jgi:hypothetical protein
MLDILTLKVHWSPKLNVEAKVHNDSGPETSPLEDNSKRKENRLELASSTTHLRIGIAEYLASVLSGWGTERNVKPPG